MTQEDPEGQKPGSEADRKAFEHAADVYSRRQVMHAAAGAAFFCSTVSLPGVGSVTKTPTSLGPKKPTTSPARRAAARRAFAPFQVDLPQPPVLQPTSVGGGVDEYEITMQPGTQEILPGKDTPIMGYNGIFPGPTIRAQKGRPVRVTQRNQLGNGQDTVVHLHGGVTEQESDGHPMDLIPDGGEYTYNYASDQAGTMLWYHDHAHGFTARALYQGLAGMYIIREPREDRLDLPRDDREVPLMITDRAFNQDGSFRYPSETPLGQGFFGDTVLVNGAVVPRMQVKRRLYRFRILNASNARVYRLALGNKVPFTQIGSDSALLPKPMGRRAVAISPGERVDIVIDFSQFRAGSTIRLRNLAADSSSTASVMRFDVGRGGGREEARVPRRLRPLELVPSVVRQRTFRLSLSTDPLEWQINGKGYSDNRIDARPRVGTSEIWHFVNESDFYHPMHSHLGHFRVLSEGGRKPAAADRGWRDTVNVRANETTSVRIYFAKFTGRYVFHCHALEHGDINMMGQLEVTP